MEIPYLVQTYRIVTRRGRQELPEEDGILLAALQMSVTVTEEARNPHTLTGNDGGKSLIGLRVLENETGILN